MNKFLVILCSMLLGAVIYNNASELTRPEELARTIALKSLKIPAWNKTYATEDGSVVTAINALIGTVTIHDSQHNKKIVLHIGALPAGWKECLPEKITYHARIKQWSEVPIEELEEEFDEHSIRNHTFPEMVDYIIQKFGKRGLYSKSGLEKGDPQLTLAGRIIHIDTDESISGEFQYTFFETANGRKVLFHRFFKPPRLHIYLLQPKTRQYQRSKRHNHSKNKDLFKDLRSMKDFYEDDLQLGQEDAREQFFDDEAASIL